MFQPTVSIVMSRNKHDDWTKIRFLVFDTISTYDVFEDRILNIPTDHPFIDVVHHISCKGRDHLEEYFNTIIQNGGEGVMLRANMSKYVHGRSSLLYKMKRFLDDDAVVIGYIDGKGKLSGKVGSLIVRDSNGTDTTFRIGTGLTAYDRELPPPIGSLITYKYQERTNDGKPRFPVFVRLKHTGGY